ncbi:MAG: Zn-dependent hydrolase [Bacteroidetes bacterium]|nr:Zn-dependent hydrolase [Bacteroidota bacterium]
MNRLSALMFLAGLWLSPLLASPVFAQSDMEKHLQQYYPVTLSASLDPLAPQQRQMLVLFMQAAQLMDEVYRLERYPDWEQLRGRIPDAATRSYFDLNYGPYDILNNNAPFVEGVAPCPPGAFFYPTDLTLKEWEAWQHPHKSNPYTVVQRDDKGKLYTLFYHEKYRIYHLKAAELLEQAARLSTDPGQTRYLKLRAEALRTDDYIASDEAWLDMKHNAVDIVIGPIESYDDGLLGLRTSHEAFVLIKDLAWSQRLERFNALLPQLQENLPVEPAYRAEKPGTGGDLNAYDVVFYAGDCNAGPKTMAINLPNDEGVQLRKGTRRLQLKNTMQAKFTHILTPIVQELLDPEQLPLVTFDAFFANTMFHEVAHGLGIKQTIRGKGLVKDALKETHSALEEAKADVLGLYMVSKLYEWGHLTEGNIQQNYVTFVCGIFRSTRFGAGSAHARANLLALNHFLTQGALVQLPNGRYHIVLDKMPSAVESLAARILQVQGDGDYAGATQWLATDGQLPDAYREAQQKLADRNIPIDIVFEQGMDVLGLQQQK